MAQYFENDDSLNDKLIDIHFKINDHAFRFVSLPGVFSNHRLDMGSRLLIEQVLKLNLTGKVLDLGCGCGVIGLSINYFNDEIDLTMSDINKRACACAYMNTQKLALKNVKIIESNIFENIEEQFNHIIINPPIRAGKKVIYQMFLEAHQYLLDEGTLLIVIRKEQGAESAHKYIQGIFGNGSLLYRKHGYHIYRYTKSKGASIYE